MKKKLLSGVLLSSVIIFTAHAQTTPVTTTPATGVQKVADKLNNGAFQTQSAVNGAANTVNAVKNGVETLKGAKDLLGIGKGKKKKAEQEAAANKTATDLQPATATLNDLGPTATTVTNTITTIFFDKIEYMQMKQMKDSLSTNKLISDIKNNFNKEGKYFIEIQHSTDSDEILEIILAKWGKIYDVEAVEAEKIVLKAK